MFPRCPTGTPSSRKETDCKGLTSMTEVEEIDFRNKAWEASKYDLSTLAVWFMRNT